MNRNVKGLIAVAVFGGVAYLIYRWVKKGGVNKLLGDKPTYPQKAIVNTDNTPYYAFDKLKGTYNTTPKGIANKGANLGNFFGRYQTITIGSNAFQGIVVYQPDESGIVVAKDKVNLK